MSRALHLLPDHEKPRERLLRHGPLALADRELLAMVLRNGGYERSAIDVAEELIAATGSLRSMAVADVDELRAVGGIGVAKAAAVIAAFELGRRAVPTPIATTLRASEDIADVARPHLNGLAKERLVLLIADSALKLRRVVVLSEGTRTATLISQRDILHAVLRSDGSSFALAHNHPSGSLLPSQDDIRATQTTRAAAEVVGLRFLDHVIIADNDWCSVC